MYHVKYKLFATKYSSVLNCREESNCIFSKFSPPIAFSNNNGPCTVKTCKLLPLNFINKTLETVMFHRRAVVSKHAQKQKWIL